MSDDKTKVFSDMRARTQENIARQKAAEYTPTTEEVRADYVRDHTRNFDSFQVGRSLTSEQEFYGENFDRWLAAHDRQVAAKAWDEGEQAGLRRADFEYGHATIQAVKRNPYRSPNGYQSFGTPPVTPEQPEGETRG